MFLCVTSREAVGTNCAAGYHNDGVDLERPQRALQQRDESRVVCELATANNRDLHLYRIRRIRVGKAQTTRVLYRKMRYFSHAPWGYVIRNAPLEYSAKRNETPPELRSHAQKYELPAPILRQLNLRRLPITVEHVPNSNVGTIIDQKYDEGTNSLMIRLALSADTYEGRLAHELVKRGRAPGLSLSHTEHTELGSDGSVLQHTITPHDVSICTQGARAGSTLANACFSGSDPGGAEWSEIERCAQTVIDPTCSIDGNFSCGDIQIQASAFSSTSWFSVSFTTKVMAAQQQQQASAPATAIATAPAPAAPAPAATASATMSDAAPSKQAIPAAALAASASAPSAPASAPSESKGGESKSESKVSDSKSAAAPAEAEADDPSSIVAAINRSAMDKAEKTRLMNQIHSAVANARKQTDLLAEGYASLIHQTIPGASVSADQIAGIDKESMQKLVETLAKPAKPAASAQPQQRDDVTDDEFRRASQMLKAIERRRVGPPLDRALLERAFGHEQDRKTEEDEASRAPKKARTPVVDALKTMNDARRPTTAGPRYATLEDMASDPDDKDPVVHGPKGDFIMKRNVIRYLNELLEHPDQIGNLGQMQMEDELDSRMR